MGVLNLIMISNNFRLFHNQLKDAIIKYPNLVITKNLNNTTFLKGVLDIPNDINEIVGNYLIELHCTEKFPYRFPKLFETGGDIPNEADFHKYPDGSCCITVLPDEILKCKNGINVSLFIEQYAVSYFANQIHKKQTGEYKNGEYAHGINGIIQFYEVLMKTANKDLWAQYFKNAFRNMKTGCSKNSICFCGSRSKYKFCHLKVFNKLKQIGEKQVLNDFKLIMI